MSFFLLREILVIYLFLFYAYSYFAIDEEFIVFIILAFWVIFLIVFYLKTISAIFSDSLETLSSEFFFFHDKKNMVLAIFRDQYYDFILLNKFLFNLFILFKNTVNASLNNKVLSIYNATNLYLSDSLNFFKAYFKVSVIFFYISVFAYFHNILNFLIKEVNDVIAIFAIKYNKIRLKNEGESLKQLYSTHYSESSIDNLLPYLVSGNKKSYEFSPNIVYGYLHNDAYPINGKILFNQIDVLKKPSVSKIVHRLNIKIYYKNLVLYCLLREFSFINLL